MWSRRVTGKSYTDSRILALRHNENEAAIDDDIARSEILARKFFPQPPLGTNVRDVEEEQASTLLQIDQAVIEEEITAVLRALPLGKAPGPDRILNEVLKALAPEISRV